MSESIAAFFTAFVCVFFGGVALFIFGVLCYLNYTSPEAVKKREERKRKRRAAAATK